MCYYIDLFGDIIVTLEDVNIWLDEIPKMRGLSQARRNYYAEFSNIANKIKLSKLDGSFDKIIKDAEMNDIYANQTVDIFKTVYKENLIDLKSIKCPDYYHVCDNPTCACYIKMIKHEKYAADYAKRKKYKRAA